MEGTPGQRADTPAGRPGRSRLHPDTTIDEVVLTVHDLERQTAFYRDVIGLDPMADAAGERRLGRGSAAWLRLVEHRHATRPERAARLYHFAMLLPSRVDLACALAGLAAAQWPLDGAADHLVSEALYLRDPEGNGIEIYRDRPRDQWPRHGHEVRMSTEPLDLAGLAGEAGPERCAAWRPPAETRVGHIHLHVLAIPSSEAFYRDVLGFDLMQRFGAEASFLGAGGYHHHVGINVWGMRGAQPADDEALGLRWFRVGVPGFAELEAVAGRLREQGWPHAGADGEIRLRDPSGHHIRLSARARLE